MGDLFIQYLKQEMLIACKHAHVKIKQPSTSVTDNSKKIKHIIISFYRRHLCSKFARLGMIFPMFLLLLSGFIEEQKISISGSLSSSSSQLYPLTQNSLPILSVPHSGMIPINNKVSAFFTQYEENENSSMHRNLPSSSIDQKNGALALVSLADTAKKGSSDYIQLKNDEPQESKINPKLPTPHIDANYIPNTYSQRKKYYIPHARNYARKYGLNPDMVIAIMYAESMFFPHLISKKNAHGLMQVVPATAGTEVNRFFKKEGEPSSNELMNPETNVHYGTTYLYLLKKYHLTGIIDPQVKDLLTIASYNAGSGAVLRHFSKNRSDAIDRVNEMTFDEVLATIITTYRSSETRRYVEKVLGYMAQI